MQRALWKTLPSLQDFHPDVRNFPLDRIVFHSIGLRSINPANIAGGPRIVNRGIRKIELFDIDALVGRVGFRSIFLGENRTTSDTLSLSHQKHDRDFQDQNRQVVALLFRLSILPRDLRSLAASPPRTLFMSQLVLDRRVRSSKSEDPDFCDLIEMYVGESAVRATQMQTLFARGDFEQLQRMAHQLRGSGAGYGFEQLSDLATSLESACETGDPCDIAEALHDTVGYLIRMEC